MQIFYDRDKMIDWCQQVGRKLHAVVIILKSDKASLVRKGRVVLGCERSELHRPKKDEELEKKMKRSSGM